MGTDAETTGRGASVDRKLLAYQMREAGVGLNQVAERLGVSRTTVHRWHQAFGGTVHARGQRAVKDPIPVDPFLKWCDARRLQITREWDAYPSIGDVKVPGKGTGSRTATLKHLMGELGWPVESGARRLHRWRFQNPGGVVSRPIVEDALWRADVSFYDVYPEFREADLIADGCVAA